MQACSFNYSCSGEAISIIYCVRERERARARQTERERESESERERKCMCVCVCVCVCVCGSLRHPACNAHASYSHLRPVRLYFPHISQTGRSRTKLFNINSLFWVSLQFLSEIFFILKRNEWDMIINVHRTSRYVPVFQERNWWNLAFLDRFSKNTQYQISWKSV